MKLPNVKPRQELPIQGGVRGNYYFGLCSWSYS